LIWAAEPGFPFVVVSCRLVFVGGTGASYVSLRPPTKTTAAILTSYHSNPCRFITCSNYHLKFTHQTR